MYNVTDTDRAYAAALLDGEGNVGISRLARGRTMQVHVDVTNTYLPVIEWLVARWGGRINRRQPAVGREIFVWRANGDCGARFLRDVRPFLQEKGALADNLLAFFAFRDSTHGMRHRFSRGGRVALPTWVIEREAEFLARHRSIMLVRRGTRHLPHQSTQLLLVAGGIR